MNIPSGTCALGKKGCFTDGKCYYNRNCENKVVTNADRIRAMSDAELAELLQYGCCPYIEGECTMRGCEYCISDWLKQPAKDGEGE